MVQTLKTDGFRTEYTTLFGKHAFKEGEQHQQKIKLFDAFKAFSNEVNQKLQVTTTELVAVRNLFTEFNKRFKLEKLDDFRVFGNGEYAYLKLLELDSDKIAKMLREDLARIKHETRWDKDQREKDENFSLERKRLFGANEKFLRESYETKTNVSQNFA